MPGNEFSDNEFERALRKGAALLGLGVSEDGIQRLLAHHRVLLKWMPRVNLTTVRHPVDMADRLYLDSAFLVPHLSAPSRLHDVGTGAGFPGLVIKALVPQLEVTLTEARRKKVSFLRQAAREMGMLTGLVIHQRRIGQTEDLPGDGWSEVVSRAAFPPEEWIKTGSALVKKGGRLWIFSGPPQGDPEEELKSRLPWMQSNLPPGFQIEEVRPYRLPLSGQERLLVSLRRQEH